MGSDLCIGYSRLSVDGFLDGGWRKVLFGSERGKGFLEQVLVHRASFIVRRVVAITEYTAYCVRSVLSGALVG
jgi:hypothetical protein